MAERYLDTSDPAYERGDDNVRTLPAGTDPVTGARGGTLTPPTETPAPQRTALPGSDTTSTRLPDVRADAASAAPSPAQTTAMPAPAASTTAAPPSATGRAAQSETPDVKPALDPRPYALVAKTYPDIKAMIDASAERHGVSPERIAAHMYVESKFNRNVGRGAAGEIGVMQMIPSTARMVNRDGSRDPFRLEDNIDMGAEYIAMLDRQYGRDSVNSVRKYNGSGPMSWDYVTGAKSGFSFFPGTKFDKGKQQELEVQARGSVATPGGMMRAGKEGPDQFMRYIVQSAPEGMPLSDIWRNAEAKLVYAFLRKGDIAGAQHAKDFILQLSYAGTNQYLMSAHKKLMAGDGVGAANDLARSHAFFPDGTTGRFRSDGRNVVAERMDENNPSRQLGPPISITPDGIAMMLNQTTNPQQYLKTLAEQQKAASDARLKLLHGQYYIDSVNQRREASAMQSVDRANALAGANARAAVVSADKQLDRDAAMDRALVAAGGRGGGREQQLFTAANKAAAEMYALEGDQSPASVARRAQLSELNVGAQMGGASRLEADRIARGLLDRSLMLQMDPAGDKYQVLDAKTRRQTAYLPKQYGDKYAPPQPAAQPTNPGQATAMSQGGATGTMIPRPPVDQSAGMPR